MSDTGEKLRAWRAQNDVNQTDLAVQLNEAVPECNATQTKISCWETGRSTPTGLPRLAIRLVAGIPEGDWDPAEVRAARARAARRQQGDPTPSDAPDQVAS